MSKTTGNYSTWLTKRNSWKGLIRMSFIMMRENNLVNQVVLKQSHYTHQTDIGMVKQEMVFQMDKGLPMYLCGATFVGTCKEGKRHEGTFIFPDGEKYIGEWKDNKRRNVVRHYKDGNIIEKLVDGEEQ